MSSKSNIVCCTTNETTHVIENCELNNLDELQEIVVVTLAD